MSAFDEALLKPVRAVLRMGEDEDLVGRERPQRIIDCLQRIVGSNAAACRYPEVGEHPKILIDSGPCDCASGVLLVCPMPKGRVQSWSDDEHLTLTALCPFADLLSKPFCADSLIGEDEDATPPVSGRSRSLGRLDRRLLAHDDNHESDAGEGERHDDDDAETDPSTCWKRASKSERKADQCTEDEQECSNQDRKGLCLTSMPLHANHSRFAAGKCSIRPLTESACGKTLTDSMTPGKAERTQPRPRERRRSASYGERRPVAGDR